MIPTVLLRRRSEPKHTGLVRRGAMGPTLLALQPVSVNEGSAPRPGYECVYATHLQDSRGRTELASSWNGEAARDGGTQCSRARERRWGWSAGTARSSWALQAAVRRTP